MSIRRNRLAGRAGLLLAIVLGAALVVAANVHLVYVAETSQPECIAHRRLGEAGERASYAAAQSGCRPSTPPKTASE